MMKVNGNGTSVVGQLESRLAGIWHSAGAFAVAADAIMTRLGAMIRARYSRTKGRNREAPYGSNLGQKLVAAGIVWRS